MKKLKIILHSKCFSFLLLLLFFCSCLLSYLFPKTSKLNPNQSSFSGTITAFQIEGDFLSIDLKGSEKIKGNYYFTTLEEKNQFSKNYALGDTITITGTWKRPNKNTVPNLFNYQQYLARNNIFYIMSIDTIQKEKASSSLFYRVKNWIGKRIEEKPEKGYYNAFFLGDTSQIEDSIFKTYQENGISHLFAISGMHISFFSGLLLFLFRKIGLKENIRYFLTIFFLFFYMILSGSSPSVSRAVVFFLFLYINKIQKLELSTLKILFFTFCLFGIIHPNIIWEVGFQYSYLVSFALILFQEKKKEQNSSYFLSVFKISIISFLIGLPITLFYFYQINVFSIFYNVFFVPFVSFLLFPTAFLSFCFSFLEPIFSLLVFILEKSSWFCSYFFSFSKLIFGKPDIWFFLAYYFCFFLCFSLQKKIGFFLLLLVLGIQYFFSFLFPSNYLLMIDVGQGDSILIHANHQNILIDTGGKIDYPKEQWQQRNTNTITDYTLVPLLKSLGIRKLDSLILTHGDYDHMGESISLLHQFLVEKVILNQGEFNDLELELITLLEKKKIPYYQNVKQFHFGKIPFYFLNTRIYASENDNSNVIYTILEGKKILLMGDAEREKEMDLLKKYDLDNIDILKVGHHGSKTSSSIEWINKISPKYSLISVGKNNRYGHPNEEVLKNLKNSIIYRTDLDGSILIKFQKHQLEIKTYPLE